MADWSAKKLSVWTYLVFTSNFKWLSKKEGDKYHKTGKQVHKNAFENKGIIRYFYSIDDLKSVMSDQFDILEINSDRHENIDSSVSVWWKILLKKIS